MQSDLKRLLAYSSISQMGYIALAIGLGSTLGIVGGVFHIINHAITKSLLFLCAGAMIYHAKSTDMYQISVRMKFGRWISYSFLLGVLALAGLPLLNGFASKWLIYIATIHFNPVLTIITLVVTALTVAYGLKAFYVLFMKNPEPRTEKAKIPWSMKIPIAVLVTLCFILGIFPEIGYWLAEMASSAFGNVEYARMVLG
jgi:multicomponent Na+:H+ antiporter subunit D